MKLGYFMSLDVILCRIMSMLPPSTDAVLNVRASIKENCQRFSISTMYNLLDDVDTLKEVIKIGLKITSFPNEQK